MAGVEACPSRRHRPMIVSLRLAVQDRVWFVAFVASGIGVFLMFGSLALGALLCFWLTVPESQGRSLQELEEDLVG